MKQNTFEPFCESGLTVFAGILAFKWLNFDLNGIKKKIKRKEMSGRVYTKIVIMGVRL